MDIMEEQMEPIKEHIFNRFEDRTNTRIEKSVLFYFNSDWSKEDFDFIEDTGYADDLQARDFFIEGVVEQLKRLGKNYEVSDTDGILKEVKYRYANILGIELPKSVRNWIKKGNPNRAREYRKNNYDFCLALEMDYNTTEEFFLKSFLTIPFNYKDRTDAVYFYCMRHGKGYKVIKAMLDEASEFESMNSEEIQTEEIGRNIRDIDDDNEFMKYLKTHCYDKKYQFKTARMKIIDLIEKNKKLARASNINELLMKIVGHESQEEYKGIQKSDLPALFTESFPKNMEISKIVNDKEVTYEVLRKALIIMKFYNFYASRQKGSLSVQEARNDLKEFYTEVNKSMADCGFIQLYLRHPFDWYILHCAKCKEPVITFKTMISKRYLDRVDD